MIFRRKSLCQLNRSFDIPGGDTVSFYCGSLLNGRLSNRPDLARRLIRTNLIFIEPMVVLWSIWGLSLSGGVLFLPLAGLLLAVTGFGLGFITLPIVRLKGRSRATYLVSSSLSNHGFTMGGFLCYLFGGVNGLGLSAIFIIYFLPYVFLVIFPFSQVQRHGGAYGSRSFRKFFMNLQNMPLYAVFFALTMQLLNVKRPSVAFPVDIFLLVNVGLYYFTLGLNFHIRDLKILRLEHLVMSCANSLFCHSLLLSCLALWTWAMTLSQS
jgi:predicted permease